LPSGPEYQKAKEREVTDATIGLGQEILGAISDFAKIGTDKKIAQAEQSKNEELKNSMSSSRPARLPRTSTMRQSNWLNKNMRRKPPMPSAGRQDSISRLPLPSSLRLWLSPRHCPTFR
jgi:hypothetical protein